jgi:kinetochore protein Spc7/SPC105
MFDYMALAAGKENVAPATSSDPLQRKGLSPRKSSKGRSKSIGPGGLEDDGAQKQEQKDEMKNRRKSAFVPAVKGILPGQADAERKAARRKSMANRRVSFAPEATLHTWDVIEYMRDHTTSTESGDSTRRASGLTQNSNSSPGSEPPSTPPEQSSSPAQSPAHQRNLHQKKRRRSSAVPPMNFNNPDDLESSMISGSSGVSGSEGEEDASEGEEEDATGTVMSLDMGDNSLLSTTESESSTSSSARLERNLREAANAAGTRGIEYDEAYEEDAGDESMEIAGDEITNAFKPWAQRHADEEDEPLHSAALDQENVNPFSPAFQASAASMLKPRYSTIAEEDEEDMSMDVTRAVGGILEARAAEQASSPIDDDGTMDFTQVVGRINNDQGESPTRNGQKRRRSTTEAGSPGYSAAQQSKRRRSSMARSSMGDETMDLTIAVGAVHESGSPVKASRRKSVARRRSSGVESDAGDATMDFTRPMGSLTISKPESDDGLGEDEDLSMELTTAFGGVQAAERAAAEQEPSTPQEPASPSAVAAEANTTPKDQERFRDVPDSGPGKSLTPLLQKQATRSAEKPASAKTSSAKSRKSSSPAKSSPARQKAEVKQLRLTRSASKDIHSKGSPLRNEVSYPDLPALDVPDLQSKSTPHLTPLRQSTGQPDSEVRSLLEAQMQDPEPSPTVEKQLRSTPVKHAQPALKARTPLMPKSPQRESDSPQIAFTTQEATPSSKAATPKPATPKSATPKLATPKATTPKALTPKDATPRSSRSGISTTPKTSSPKRQVASNLNATPTPATPQEHQVRDVATPVQQASPFSKATPQHPQKEATRLADTIKLMSTPRKEMLKALTPKKHTPKKHTSPMKRPTPAGKPTPKTRSGAQKSPAQQLSENIFELQPAVEKKQVRLQEFLDAASIRFMDLTTTKRRMTYAPTPSKNRQGNSEDDDEAEVTLESAVVAAACTEPEKELFSHACHELKRYIHEGKGAIKELEAETFQDTPRLIQAYMSADPERKIAIDAQLRDMKTHARLRSKEMWYGWRSQLLDELMHVLQGIAEGLLRDDEILQASEEALNQALPQMTEQQLALKQEAEQLEAELSAASEEEKEELDAARDRITAVDAELAEKRRILEELQYDVQEQEEIGENLRETKDEFTAAIKEAERVRESYRTISVEEINALKRKRHSKHTHADDILLTTSAESVKSLEDTYGWTITTATSSPPTVTMTYKSSLQLFFHPSAFRTPSSPQDETPRPNRPIGLTYTGTTQPLPTTIRFFLQLLRASLHALPQSTTKVSSLLHFVSSGWTTALNIAESERRLSIEGLTDTRIVSDERLSIASLILLPKMKTKVRISFDILAAIGEGLALSESVEVDVHVVYGEAVNENKLREVLKGTVKGGVEGWEGAVRELKGMLVSQASRVVKR